MESSSRLPMQRSPLFGCPGFVRREIGFVLAREMKIIFVQSIGSGEKIHMRRKGRSFVVGGTFGEEWQQLTIDSAAEENVCPKEWGQKLFGTSPIEENNKIKFVAANGNSIDHYGERKITLNTKSTF